MLIAPTSSWNFFGKVEVVGDCWLWRGSQVGATGYGKFTITRGGVKATYRAHRFSYCLFKGPIPEGLVLDHLCRTKLCVSPFHLEAVTVQVNTLRGRTGEAATARNLASWGTHCKAGHPRTPENTYVYAGGKRRTCLPCYKQKSLAYYYRVGKGRRQSHSSSAHRA